MSLSLNELESLCRRAARGARFEWGPAEEAGRAVRALASVGLPGPERLLERLVRADVDIAPPCSRSPRSLDGDWSSASGELCPIHAGAALSDSAHRLAGNAPLALHDVLCPLLLLPFAALAARQLGVPVGISWSTLTLSAVPDSRAGATWLDGARVHAGDGRTGTVRCRLWPSREAVGGRRLPAFTRAEPAPAVLAGLEAFAARTCAPATEASRRLGAGGSGAGPERTADIERHG